MEFRVKGVIFLDKDTARKILGVLEGATEDEINKRYEVLLKKLKYDAKESSGGVKEIETAYKVLSGLDIYDKEAEEQKKKRLENPNPFFKLLGLDEYKTKNFFHYHKWHIVIGLVLIIVAVTTIHGIVTRVDPDLKMVITGALYSENSEALQASILEEIPGLVAVQVQDIPLSENLDAQMLMAMQQKIMVEMMAGENDLYLMDLETYKSLAAQGAFKAMDTFIAQVESSGDEAVKSLLKPAPAVALAQDEEEEPTEPVIYGIDITGSTFLKEAGIYGDTIIATFGHDSGYPANGEALLTKLIGSVKESK